MATRPSFQPTLPGPTKALARVRRVGPFGLVASIGDDAAGTSWAAVTQAHGHVDTRILLSLRPKFVADSTFVRILGREVDIGRRVRHHAVLEPRENGLSGEGGYVTVDYVASIPLTRLFTLRVPIPLGVVARIVRDLYSALHELHRTTHGSGELQPLLGRIASPGWVRLGIDGRAYAVDHGVAAALFATGALSEQERRLTMALLPDWAKSLSAEVDFACVARIGQRLLSAGRRSESGLFALPRDESAKRRIDLLEALEPISAGEIEPATTLDAAWGLWDEKLGSERAYSPGEVADWLASAIPYAVRNERQRDEALGATSWHLIMPSASPFCGPAPSLTAVSRDGWDELEETTIHVRDDDVELFESDIRPVADAHSRGRRASPGFERPVCASSPSGSSASGTPASGTPALETPASGAPASGTHASGTPASVSPAMASPGAASAPESSVEDGRAESSASPIPIDERASHGFIWMLLAMAIAAWLGWLAA